MEHEQAKSNQDSPLTWFRLFVCSGCFAVLACGVLFAALGKIGVAKMLTCLVSPLGVAWWAFGSLALAYFSLGRLGRAAVLTFVFVAFWAVSCEVTASFCSGLIESRVETTDVEMLTEPLDYVIVLGGGTRQGPFRAQAAHSGDRVVYGAQLYHTGITKHLVTTGQVLDALPTSVSGERPQRVDLSVQTEEIWNGLGIDSNDITKLSGRNTKEEMKSIREWLEKQNAPRPLHVGILTSATHLPRAMRLATNAGIIDEYGSPALPGLAGLVPFAAEIRDTKQPRTALDLIPSADALAQVGRCQKEFIAWCVGR